MAARTLKAEGVAISVVRQAETAATADALTELRRQLDPHVLLFAGGGGMAAIPEARLPGRLIRLTGLDGFAAHHPERRRA